jgi:HD-like signal output (HDOD) protein
MSVATLAREKILTTARSLPAAPQILAQLGELLQDVNADLDQIAQLLKRDAALVARILRISNSAYFGGGGQIGGIEDAVNRVGFGEVYRLVGVATTSRLVDRALVYYGVEAESLREHMLFTALAAEALAKESGRDARSAYTAGILRPLGMLILDRVARERLTPSDAFNPKQYSGYVEWEGNLFSIGNGEVAALILEEWRFPAEIVAGVRMHYLLRDADAECPLACVLNVASWLATQGGFGLPGERSYWELALRSLSGAGLAEEVVRPVGMRVREEFERLRHTLQ